MRRKLKIFLCSIFALLLVAADGIAAFAGGNDASGSSFAETDSYFYLSSYEEGAVSAGNLRKTSARLLKKYGKEKTAYLHFTYPNVRIVPFRTVKLKLNRTVRKVSFSSSAPKIVSVSRKGIILSKKSGTAVITAKSGKYTCHAVVTVYPSLGAVSERRKNRVISAASISQQRKDTKTGQTTKKRVLLAGSSSFDKWSTAAYAFPGCEVINNAIGRTTAGMWAGTLYEKLIVPYQPDALVLYVGVNDIGRTGKVSAQECADRVKRLISNVRTSLGENLPIFYVSMVYAPGRKKTWQSQMEANSLIEEYCQSQKNVFYIDIASSFMNSKGKPIKSYFSSDQIHPSTKGYRIFSRLVGRKVASIVSRGQTENTVSAAAEAASDTDASQTDQQ